MFYTISGNLIFSNKKDADEVFELLKAKKDHFIEINTDNPNMTTEKSSLQLVQSDHDLIPTKRTGSKVLKDLNSKSLIEKIKEIL